MLMETVPPSQRLKVIDDATSWHHRSLWIPTNADCVVMVGIIATTGLSGWEALRVSILKIFNGIHPGMLAAADIPGAATEGLGAFGAAAVVGTICVLMVRQVLAQNKKLTDHIMRENNKLKGIPDPPSSEN